MTCIDCAIVRIGREAKVGRPIRIPAGVPVHSMAPSAPSDDVPLKRAQTVIPHFVDRYADGKVVVTWAGGGGYWRRVTARDGRGEVCPR
jgi:hypothetical protein